MNFQKNLDSLVSSNLNSKLFWFHSAHPYVYVYLVVHSVINFLTKIIQDYAGVLVVKSKEGDFLRNLWPSQNILTLLQKFSVTAFKVRFGQ